VQGKGASNKKRRERKKGKNRKERKEKNEADFFWLQKASLKPFGQKRVSK